MKNIKFCSLKKKDKYLIYKWRNSKLANKFLLKKKINNDEHNEWFLKKLNNKDSLAWIINFNKHKIGLAQTNKIKKKTCNAGFYIINRKYSYLTFLVINLLHYKIFCEYDYKAIQSYINVKNNKIRKLNKMCGYKENKKKCRDFIFTRLTYSKWSKSLGYKYLKGIYGNL